MKEKSKNYFGDRKFVNRFVSKLLFRSLEYRRHFLIRKNRNTGQTVQLENSAETRDQFQSFLDRGYTRINLGGGRKNLKGFVNIDFARHAEARQQVTANILDLSFIPDGSLTHVHSNHLLEHLTQSQLEDQLSQYRRILTKNGLLSIRCPNALGVTYGFFFGAVAEKDRDEFLDLGFPRDEDFHLEHDGWYYRDLWALYHWLYGFTGNIENQHLNLLTPTLLKETVENGEFIILKMANPEASNLVLMAKKGEAV